MILNKTVVVVGAGASFDLGLPLGSDLQQRVAELISGNNTNFNPSYRHAVSSAIDEDPKPFFFRARKLCNGLKFAASVDNFLDQEKYDKNFVLAAKLAIAYCILEAEAGSAIASKSSPEKIYSAAVGSNYFLCSLLNFVIRGHQRGNIGDSLDNLTFVIFNYDRCVERVMYAWLEMRFGQAAGELFSRVKFIHVYGSLGPYSPIAPGAFDRPPTDPLLNAHFSLNAFRDQIKVFTEQEDSWVATSVPSSISASGCLIFVGFGFEEQNMRFFRHVQGMHRSAFATMKNLSQPNAYAVKSRLERDLARVVHHIDGVGDQLFSEYYHLLAESIKTLPDV